MTPEEKVEYVKEYLLDDALKSMKQYGRYWHGSISRTLAPTLKVLLQNSGYTNVQMREIPPDWEHVYYMYEDKEIVEKIAYDRHLCRTVNLNCTNEDLPK